MIDPVELGTTIAAVFIGGYVAMRKIMAQLKPNGGSSLRDAVDRIDKNLLLLQAQFRGKLDLEGAGYFITDAEGKCVWVSQVWSSLTGTSLQQAMGDGWVRGIHDDDRATVFDQWRMSTAADLPFAMSYKTALGIRVDGRSIKLPDASGSTQGYLGSLVPRVAPEDRK